MMLPGQAEHLTGFRKVVSSDPTQGQEGPSTSCPVGTATIGNAITITLTEKEK